MSFAAIDVELKKDHAEISLYNSSFEEATTSYEVWYRKPEGGYTMVALVKAHSLDQVYVAMQHENWTPRGEAFNLVQRIRLDHVSMQEGDLVRDVEKDCWYFWTESGFNKIEIGCKPPDNRKSRNAKL